MLHSSQALGQTDPTGKDATAMLAQTLSHDGDICARAALATYEAAAAVLPRNLARACSFTRRILGVDLRVTASDVRLLPVSTPQDLLASGVGIHRRRVLANLEFEATRDDQAATLSGRQSNVYIGDLPWPVGVDEDATGVPAYMKSMFLSMSRGVPETYVAFRALPGRNQPLVMREASRGVIHTTVYSVLPEDQTRFRRFVMEMRMQADGRCAATIRLFRAGRETQLSLGINMATIVLALGWTRQNAMELIERMLAREPWGRAVKPATLGSLWVFEKSAVDQASARQLIRSRVDQIRRECGDDAVHVEQDAMDMLPHLNVEQSDATWDDSRCRFILAAAVKMLGVAVGGQPEDDASELHQQYVRTPGEVLATMATRAGQEFTGQIIASQWARIQAVAPIDRNGRETHKAYRSRVTDQLLAKGTDAVWERLGLDAQPVQLRLGGSPSSRFDRIGTEFLHRHRIGRDRKDVSFALDMDLSGLGRLSVASRLHISAEVRRHSTSEDRMQRRGVQPSHAGYLCPVHVNSSEGSAGGTKLHLAWTARISGPCSADDVGALRTLLLEMRTPLDDIPSEDRVLVCIHGAPVSVLDRRSAVKDGQLQIPACGCKTCTACVARGVVHKLHMTTSQHPDLGRLWPEFPGAMDLQLGPGRYLRPLLSGSPGDTLEATLGAGRARMVSPMELLALAPVAHSWVETPLVRRVGQLMELPPAGRVGVMAAHEPFLTCARGAKVTLAVSHMCRELQPHEQSWPLVTTTMGASLGTDLESGALGMLAVLPMGPYSGCGNEEDALVVSRGAAERGLLRYVPRHTVRVRLPPVSTWPESVDMKFGRITVDEVAPAANTRLNVLSETGMPTVDVSIVPGSNYVVGVLAVKDGKTVDRSRWAPEGRQAKVLKVSHGADGRSVTVQLRCGQKLSTMSVALRAGETFGKPTHEQVLRRIVCEHTGIQGDGLPRPGTRLRNGDVVVGMVQRPIGDGRQDVPKDRSVRLRAPGSGVHWTVERAVRDMDQVTVFLVGESQPLITGAKVALRQGQKGAVYLTDHMPVFPGGVTPDVVMHTCAIAGRCTPALLLEQLIGEVCCRKGTRAVLDAAALHHHFDGQADREWTMADLVSGRIVDNLNTRMSCVCAVTGKMLSDSAFCGPVTVRRLRQSGQFSAVECLKVESGLDLAVDRYTLQPKRHRRPDEPADSSSSDDDNEDAHNEDAAQDEDGAAQRAGALRVGTQELEKMAACGSSYWVRGVRSDDEQPVYVCRECDAIFQVYKGGNDRRVACGNCHKQDTIVCRVVPKSMLVLMATLGGLGVGLKVRTRAAVPHADGVVVAEERVDSGAPAAADDDDTDDSDGFTRVTVR